MNSIPEWVEFTFRTADGDLYWGSADFYQHPERGYKNRWGDSTYQHWKNSGRAQIVIHQLEND